METAHESGDLGERSGRVDARVSRVMPVDPADVLHHLLAVFDSARSGGALESDFGQVLEQGMDSGALLTRLPSHESAMRQRLAQSSLGSRRHLVG
jgi:hypothetical protein